MLIYSCFLFFIYCFMVIIIEFGTKIHEFLLKADMNEIKMNQNAFFCCFSFIFATECIEKNIHD